MVAPRVSTGPVEFLERGSIFFAYRPRIGAAAVRELGDVERLYAILIPETGDRLAPLRVITIGRKRMAQAPDGNGPGGAVGVRGGPARYWGMVTRVADTLEKVAQELGQEEYVLPGGERCARAAARPCGEGAYCVVRHGAHTHLAYLLDRAAAGDVEAGWAVRLAAGIGGRGNYLLLVKTPAGGGAPKAAGAAGGEEEARYPDRLQDRFAGRPLIAAETTVYLD